MLPSHAHIHDFTKVRGQSHDLMVHYKHYVTSSVVTTCDVIITCVKERHRDYQTVGQHTQQCQVPVTVITYTPDLCVYL